METIKVIYIVGCGRSGTTIMDILLGNHVGLLSVGELIHAHDNWNEDKLCSCGANLKKCDVWGDVGVEFFEYNSENSYYNIIKRQKDIEKQSSIVKHIFGFYPKSVVQNYHSYVYGVFEMLKKKSSSSQIIDSSKSIGRCLLLLKNKKLNVKVIHLVRDPRGVYLSFQKKTIVTPTKSIFSLSFYWLIVNFLAEILRLKYGKNKVLRIRYEDLVTNSDVTLKEIQKFLCIDLSDVNKKIKNKIPMQRGHLASGNRLKNQDKPIVLQPDLEWGVKIKLHQRLLVQFLCLPHMFYYKYFD